MGSARHCGGTMNELRTVYSARDPLYEQFIQAARKEGGSHLVVDGPALLEAALQAVSDPRASLHVRGVLWNARALDGPHVQALSALATQHGAEVAMTSAGMLGALRIGPSVPQCLGLLDKAVLTGQRPALLLQQGIDRVLLLVSVIDPMNVGVILRTAEALGYEVVAAEDTASLLSRRVIRSSTGSALRMVLRQSDLLATDFVQQWRQQGGQAVTTSAHGSLPLHRMEWRLPHLVCVGNETHGLAAEVRRLGDADIRIPMVGPAHSLNVTVATGIVIAQGSMATVSDYR
jgi:tRNA G18 (ribose-2'-O)-methylase SpoU